MIKTKTTQKQSIVKTKKRRTKLIAVKKFKNENQVLTFDEKEIRIEGRKGIDIKIWAAHLKANIELSVIKNLVIITSFNKNSFGKEWQILFNAKNYAQQKEILDYFFKWYKDRKKKDE